jgi:hypothetical protein
MFIDLLEFPEIQSRQNAIKPAHAKTCSWLLQDESYKHWIDPSKYRENGGFFWITGKPGAGKSTLLKFALQHTQRKLQLESEHQHMLASHFFNARGARLERCVEGMYRSIIGQILRGLPKLGADLLDKYEELRKRKLNSKATEPEWDLGTLQTLLIVAIRNLGTTSLICFIDALDECDQDEDEDMVQFFFEDLKDIAIDTGVKAFTFFSNRHYPYIDLPTVKLRLVLEHQTGHDADMEEYVESKLRLGSGSARQDITARILDKSAGIFLWVVLVVNILNTEFKRGRLFAVNKWLDELPMGLSELFKDMILRDRVYMSDLLLCIQWLLVSKRPLQPEEFYDALASTDGPGRTFNQSLNVTEDVMDRFILVSSKGLAEIQQTSQTVQFIRESVKDFLLEEDGVASLWPEYADPTFFMTTSHERLKRCCDL